MMATTTNELKRLHHEIELLKQRVAQLERQGNKEVKPASTRRMTFVTDENARADTVLRRAGMLSEPTESERRIVEEWKRVATKERTRLIQEFRTAKLDAPLAQIVIESRR